MAHSTEFNQTEFIMYDKSSSDNICDRLIEVRPFEWVLLNTQKQLFILNPEQMVSCTNDTVPAIRVFANRFENTCLQYTNDFIEKVYKSEISELVTITVIPFELKPATTVFTILSAINMLLDHKLLLYDLNETIIEHSIPKSSVYTMHASGTHKPTNFMSRIVRNIIAKNYIHRKRDNFIHHAQNKIEKEFDYIQYNKRSNRRKTKYDIVQETVHQLTNKEHYDHLINDKLIKRIL